ncbi:putative dehydrogenase [Saonia flava]|uniref:Putative dehydrogenase n=1 Tax=Saonia flava TaxID=523696 RepID=A0A846QYG4_9FLAO|nr:Gfo/Idh/MocA family oxidoreductase [Saonia flava]NJB69659.1 putative dehydrogenase [Saonia flava]
MKEKIRWGIIGLGGIAKKFADDLKLVDDGQLVAVASRSLDKAKAFAKDYNVKNAFGSYDELFKFPDVDVLYIATPHDSHAELSIAAMTNGKHILCEKPVAVNRKDVEKMVAASKANNLFLMEAMWSRFNPSIIKVKELIDDGAIGDVAYVNSDFTYYGLDRDEEGRILNPELAGGSILDIGIYPIFLAYLILGKPNEIIARSNFYKTGVEIQTSMIFDYENSQAILHSGFATDLQVKGKISGSKGSLVLHPMWHMAQGYSIEKGGAVQDFKLPTLGMGYSYEIIEVHNCLRAGKLESDLWSHQNSLDLMELMDEVRRQVGVVFPFES